jgi:adenylosuccinate lyase
MRAVFEEKARLQAWMDVEAALALAQADLGIVPKEAAQKIADCAKINLLDLQAIKARGKVTGHSLVGLLGEFRTVLGKEAAGFLHFGATTQDIIDSGQMICAKNAVALIEEQLTAAMRTLMALMDEHSRTLMVGRTHGQQALPITLGFKMAIWLDELSRQRDRLLEAKKRDLVGNMTGAVGTFASWGKKGMEIQSRTMEILGLGAPDTCWHSSRDRVADLMALLGLLGGTAARIATEVYNLSKTEFGELEEPIGKGQVGSSTMPHKRNPIHSEWIIVLARSLRANAGQAMEVMIQENERDASAWKTEWIIVPESFVMASAILQHLQNIFSGLVVRKVRMEKNTHLLKGLLLSEAVMFVLADAMPLPEAHERVYEASMKAFEKETNLLDELLKDPEVKRLCDRKKIAEAMNAANYTGLSAETVAIIKRKIEAKLGKG